VSLAPAPGLYRAAFDRSTFLHDELSTGREVDDARVVRHPRHVDAAGIVSMPADELMS